jgi:hypothetical protein
MSFRLRVPETAVSLVYVDRDLGHPVSNTGALGRSRRIVQTTIIGARLIALARPGASVPGVQTPTTTGILLDALP